MELKDWFTIVTWLTAILGWIVVNYQNNRREGRKEIRSAINEIVELIEKTENEAVNYHTSEDSNPTLSIKIKTSLTKIADRIRYLELHDSKTSRNLYDFRSAITIRNFDTASHSQQAMDSELIEELSAAAANLIDSLETSFSSLYRAPVHQTLIREFRRLLAVTKP